MSLFDRVIEDESLVEAEAAVSSLMSAKSSLEGIGDRLKTIEALVRKQLKVAKPGARQSLDRRVHKAMRARGAVSTAIDHLDQAIQG